MATGKPTQKMAAAGVGLSAGVALVWTLGQFGVDMPDTVAAAFVALAGWAAGWLKSEGKRGEHAAD